MVKEGEFSCLSIDDVFLAKGSDILFVHRNDQKPTEGFVGIHVIIEDLGDHHMVILQVSDGSTGSPSRNVWFKSRIYWRNKLNIG